MFGFAFACFFYMSLLSKLKETHQGLCSPGLIYFDNFLTQVIKDFCCDQNLTYQSYSIMWTKKIKGLFGADW